MPTGEPSWWTTELATRAAAKWYGIDSPFCPVAYDGCQCCCHTQAGVKHVVACCHPPPAEVDPRDAEIASLRRQLAVAHEDIKVYEQKLADGWTHPNDVACEINRLKTLAKRIWVSTADRRPPYRTRVLVRRQHSWNPGVWWYDVLSYERHWMPPAFAPGWRTECGTAPLTEYDAWCFID